MGWGLPTAESIRAVKQAVPGMTVFASGGIQDGLDIAKCVALGASLGGMAGNFLRAAAVSAEKAAGLMKLTRRQIQVSMFAAGIGSLQELAQANLQER